jgi:flagellar assembly factor FliW
VQTINVSRLDLGNSIVGFEEFRYFTLEKIEGENPFFLLRSEADDPIEFVLLSPFEVDERYEFEIPVGIKQELNLSSPEDVMVLCLVNVQQPFTESTLNMIAPLVVNVKNGLARQIILNGSAYYAKTRMFPKHSKGE